MIRGLTTSLSGMLADEQLMQLESNNLANMETPGFKTSDGVMMAFPEQLIEQFNQGDGAAVPLGTMTNGVVMQEGVPLFTEGALSQTGRNLDVAIVDASTVGGFASASPQSGVGPVQVGAGGRLEIGGVPVPVVSLSGQTANNVIAYRNPNYKGTTLVSNQGMPVYDSQGNPSIVFRNGNGQVVSIPSVNGQQYFLRVGDSSSMGPHSFFAVDYRSGEGATGIALTRDGHFSVNANNQLTDSNGNPVLPVNATGVPVQGYRIVINPKYHGSAIFQSDGQPVTDAQGQASYYVTDANGNRVQGFRLGVVNANVGLLDPLGGGEYMVGGTLANAQVLADLAPGTGTMGPGELEESNVNETQSMTNMLPVLQQYQANQQALQDEVQTLGDAVTDVGRVQI